MIGSVASMGKWATEVVRRVRLPQRPVEGHPDSTEGFPDRSIPNRLRKIPRRPVLLLALALAVLIVGLLAVVPPALAATFEVKSTGDQADADTTDGVCDADPAAMGSQCTLRAAIQQANATSGTDNITFGIGTGLQTIALNSQLPEITDPVVIDGTTQEGFDTTTHQPIIELNGANAGSGVNGLVISAGSSTVRGLVINRFGDANANSSIAGHGIVLRTNGGNTVQGNYIGTDASGQGDLGNGTAGVFIDRAPNNTVGGTAAEARNVISGNDGFGIRNFYGAGNRVEGNYIGTDASGQRGLGNSLSGVYIYEAHSNTVGGTAEGARNVISGNNLDGIRIYGSESFGNRALGNYIGTDASGSSALGNASHGVFIEGASDNTVGGTAAGARNVISGNGHQGIRITIFSVDNALGNAILSNSIHSNGRLGIDLGGDGVSQNDEDDPDFGANNLQNFPDLVSAKKDTTGTTKISGTLNSTANWTFTVQFFSSPEKDPSGYGEGKTYLGERSVTTDGSGDASFTFDTTSPSVGEFVTATATSRNGTSEFSRAVTVIIPPSISSITNGGAVDEGSSATITVTATGAGTLSYEFDCDNDNTFEVGPQAGNTTNCAFGDDGTRRVNARVTDGNGGEATDHTDVTVNNVSPGVTAPAAQRTDVGASTNFDLGSFADPGDDGPWSVSVDWGDNSTDTFEAASTGTLPQQAHTYAGDGEYTLTVTVGESGTDAPSGSATFRVTVSPLNSRPVATDDGYSTGEDERLVVPAANGVLKNDTDAEGDPLTATKLSDPQHGTVTLEANGSFAYTPDRDYNGEDSFTYGVNDGTKDAARTATVTLEITPKNDPPTFTMGADQTVNEDDGPRTVENWASNISAGPPDEAGQEVSFTLTNNNPGLFSAQPKLSPNGTLTYTPAKDRNGKATVRVTASDGPVSANTGATATASANRTFTITVRAVNDAPVARDDRYTVNEDRTLSVPPRGVLKNDTDVDKDRLSSAMIGRPKHGTLALKADGSFTYKPKPNFNGRDSFTYRTSDGKGGADTATVTVTVRPVADPPVARNDSFSVREYSRLTVRPPGVLKNDSDAERDRLTARLVARPKHGSLTLKADGSFVYTPRRNYNGTDSFTYRASGGGAMSGIARVEIKVLPVPEPWPGIGGINQTGNQFR
jgi:CSLREA domain-containing protein